MQESLSGKQRFNPVQWIAAALLVLVGYIHFSLVVNMFGLHGRLGILFALNALGALAALILIFTRLRAVGWILGILVSGGAAFAKLTMGSIPGMRTLLMGRTFPGRRFPGGGFPRSQRGSFANAAGSHTGHFAVRHNVLPTFFNMRALGTVSIVIEVLFVVLAVYAVFFHRGSSTPPSVESNG